MGAPPGRRRTPQAPAPSGGRAAHTRGAHGPGDGRLRVLRFDGLSLNPQPREVARAERQISLTKIEFDLLELFMHHPRQVLTRDQILDLVWGYTFDSGTNSLAVYIGYLRRKLEEAGESRLIQTVRGVGYALRPS